MAGPLAAGLAGLLTGILSAFGVGGGTLLLLWLSLFAGMDQHTAQGINLLYFLPTAAAALPSHAKNGFLDKKTALRAIPAGLIGTALAAWLATSLEVDLLRRLFGGYLLFLGLRELFKKRAPK